MRSFAQLRFRHFPQRTIERARAEEERRLQQRALDLALEDAGAHEIEEALDEHLAHAVQARHRTARSRAAPPARGRPDRAAPAMSRNSALLRWRRISACATASPSDPMPSCKRAAVDHGARDMQAGGVFGEIDRLPRRGEQRKVGRRSLQHQVEFAGRNVGVARHERQLGIDLPDEQEIALRRARGTPADRA